MKRVLLAGTLCVLAFAGSTACSNKAIANAIAIAGPTGSSNTVVTGITIDPADDQSIVRTSVNGVCIAQKQFRVRVLPSDATQAFTSSITPATGATFSDGIFAATVNGDYVLTVQAAGTIYVASVKVKVTGACGGGTGENPNPPTNPPTNPPQVPAASVVLTASPSTINVGQGSDLTWSSANAGYCSWIQGLSGDVGNSGTVRVTPSVTTSYTIRCFGSGGSGDATVTVTVNGQPPPPPPPSNTYSISIFPTSGTGQVGTTQQVTAACLQNGVAVSCSPTWTSSIPSFVGVNGNGLVSYLSPGSSTVCAMWQAQTACGSFMAITTPPPPPPPPPSVVSISVQPKTFSCSVGGQANVGANVTVTAGSNLSTAVTWSVSDPTVVSVKETNQNTVILSCLKVGSVTVTARAVADPSKSDSATGTVTTNVITCTWSVATGLQPDGSVIIARGQSITATGNCSNGALPAWFSSDPSRVGVRGDSVTVINGKSFQTGNGSTVTAVFTGQASVCIQAAIDETSPAFCRTVIVR